MAIRNMIFALLVSSVLMGQSPVTPSGVSNQGSSPRAGAPQQTSSSDSELAQMRHDLSIMESLNNNMSSEIEFLHDQNLQILLRTNAQMWSILIRDLHQQIDREEGRRSSYPAQPELAPAPRPR
jgi:hypothetical protein